MNKNILLLIAIITLNGCSNTTLVKPPASTDKAVSKQTLECPILQSDHWHAWLDKYEQKGNSFRLNINGEITLPHSAFYLKWSRGPLDRRSPPNLRLYLTPAPLEGMAIQVITKEMIDYKMNTAINHFKHVTIYCNNKLLAQIDDVTLTD